MAASERVKVSFNLPEDELESLKRIAARRNTSVTDVLRRAIALEQFAEEAEDRGAKLLIEEKDRSMRQLLIR